MCVVGDSNYSQSTLCWTAECLCTVPVQRVGKLLPSCLQTVTGLAGASVLAGFSET